MLFRVYLLRSLVFKYDIPNLLVLSFEYISVCVKPYIFTTVHSTQALLFFHMNNSC